MADIIFASDLDNTLIHSYRRKRPGDICVERLDGAEHNFLSSRAVELLREAVGSALFVPVTTRSLEQYRRIEWPPGCAPEYAFAANGGLLLRGAKIHEDWRRDMIRRAAPYRDEMQRLEPLLSSHAGCLRCRLVDELFLSAYCENSADAATCAEDARGQTSLPVIALGRKFYLFPPGLHKGVAAEKLRDCRPGGTLLYAGDSAMDVPLLERADYAVVPDTRLAGLLENRNVLVCGEERQFSEFVLEAVLELSAR